MNEWFERHVFSEWHDKTAYRDFLPKAKEIFHLETEGDECD